MLLLRKDLLGSANVGPSGAAFEKSGARRGLPTLRPHHSHLIDCREPPGLLLSCPMLWRQHFDYSVRVIAQWNYLTGTSITTPCSPDTSQPSLDLPCPRRMAASVAPTNTPDLQVRSARVGQGMKVTTLEGETVHGQCLTKKADRKQAAQEHAPGHQPA